MSKTNRPLIDEETKKLILSRLFVENYVSKPNNDNTVVGYFNGEVIKIAFYGSNCDVKQIDGENRNAKFLNPVINAFFGTKGLKHTTFESINLSKEIRACIRCEKTSLTFLFCYRRKEEMP